MLNREIDAITKSDVDALIEQGAVESKQLEFKRQLPAASDAGKKEFLRDVSSFANASGGDILFGVSEEDSEGRSFGYASSIVPIAAEQLDATKCWLEDVVRNGIAPRLKVQLQEVAGYGESGKDFVLVLRVPKSFAAPHVVSYKGGFRFYSRNSAGKYPLDVAELRSHFLATESQSERIRQFRQERTGRLIAGETVLPLSSDQLAVLHVIPLGPFLNNDRQPLSELQHSPHFCPFGGYGTSRYNLDGRLAYVQQGQNPDSFEGYCQLFFNGAVETVSSDFITPRSDRDRPDFAGSLGCTYFEEQILEAVARYASGYKALGVNGPVTVSFSLLNCEGVVLATGNNYAFRSTPAALDRSVALFPDIIIETIEDYTRADIRPLLDSVWNAFGHSKSINFNDAGEWRPR